MFSLIPKKDGMVCKVPTVDYFKSLPHIVDSSILISENDEFRFEESFNWGVFLVIKADSFEDFLDKAISIYDQDLIEVQ